MVRPRRGYRKKSQYMRMPLWFVVELCFCSRGSLVFVCEGATYSLMPVDRRLYCHEQDLEDERAQHECAVGAAWLLSVCLEDVPEQTDALRKGEPAGEGNAFYQ